MDDQQLSAITAQIEKAQRLVRSMCDACDLGVHQYDSISRGLAGGELLIAEVERLKAMLGNAEQRCAAYRAALGVITRLPVGQCEMCDISPGGSESNWVEPCSCCEEAHIVARATLEVR